MIVFILRRSLNIYAAILLTLTVRFVLSRSPRPQAAQVKFFGAQRFYKIR